MSAPPPANPTPTPPAASSLADIAARLVALAIASLFLIAAVLKLSSPFNFVAVVAYLLPAEAPGPFARAVAGAVVGWEILLGLALALAPRDRRVLAAVLATLAFFTATLVYLGFDPKAPSCSCFGPLDAAKRAGVGLWTGLIRNIALALPILWLWTRAGPGARPSKTAAPAPTHAPAASAAGNSAPRAFTLVELLVSIAVITTVVALTLPSLRHARHDALYAATNSNQRQLIAGVSSYTSDHAGTLPYLATPAQPFTPIMVAGKPLRRQGYFRDQAAYWYSVVNTDYVGLPDTTLAVPPMLSPHEAPLHLRPGVLTAPRYNMTATAFADPAFWREMVGSEIPPVLPMLRPQRLADAGAPSSKGLLYDIALGFFNPSDPAFRPLIPTAWADGSASNFADSQIDHDLYVHNPPLGALGLPIIATRNGLAGRDR